MPTSIPFTTFTPTVPLLSQSCPNLQTIQAGEGMHFPQLHSSSRVVDIIRSASIWRMQEHCIPDVNGYLQVSGISSQPKKSLVKSTVNASNSRHSSLGTQSSKPTSTRRSSSVRHKGERSASRNQPTLPTTNKLPKDNPKPSSSTRNSTNGSGRRGHPNLVGPDTNVERTIFHDCPPSMRDRLPYALEGASNFTILGGNWGVQNGSVNHYTVFSDGSRIVESLTETEQGPLGRRKQKRRGTG